MKTKAILKLLIVSLFIGGFTACDTQSLTDLDDPKYMLTPENADMSMMFPNLLRYHGRNSAGGNAIRVEGTYSKFYASYSFLTNVGGIYMFDQGVNDEQWTNSYRETLKLAVTLEDYLVNLDDPMQVNNIAFVRIMKCAVLQRLTDYYGSIPASEAGLAYISDVLKPKYDSQEEVYDYMLKTLDAEATALTDNQEVSTYTWSGNNDAKKARDIVYGGNITKWKKYAYSLMLRLAMRMSSIKPDVAKTYAEKAIAAGVILSNADNWTLETQDGLNDEKNPYSSWFYGSPSGDPEKYVKLGEYFINFLKANNDPRKIIYFGARLKSDIADTNAGNMQSYWWDETKWDWDTSTAKGMLHGMTANPSSTVAEYMHTYTGPNQFLFTLDQPLVIMTASEMYFWIAEAALNGWTTGTSAEAAYKTAIELNMQQLNTYPGLLDWQQISATDIETYIASKPLGSGTAARQRLAEELWISMYLNPSEVWFNVRRMDLKLPDNTTNAHMPVRHAYPEDERANNLENMNTGLQQMGISTNASREQEWATRVWWDTKDNY